MRTSLNSFRGSIFVASIAVLAFVLNSSVRARFYQISAHLSSFRPISTMSYSKELKVAELAVQRAAVLTKKVFKEKAKGTLSKDDKSPVTIGDFGAQALIIQAIKKNFPDDEIVGEEEASSLRNEKELSSQIWRLVKEVKLEDAESDSLLGGPMPSESAMLDSIDQGSSAGGAKGRLWALDPIDGTKGFLRGGQYAVCLGLIIDGHWSQPDG
jgi:3'(2'), 5'-bisphosphate nucleotidase